MGTSYISRPNVQGSSLHAVMASLATRLGRGLKPVTQVIDSEYLTPPRRHQDTDRSLKGLTSVHISHPDWTAVRPVHPTCRDSSPDVSSVVTDGWPALSGGSFNNQIKITAMKRTVNHLAGLLLLAAALLAASCGKENAEVAVKSVSVSPASLSLTEGESASLSATVLPDNASDKSLSWASSDRSVASVDNSGKVTALKAGSATISATAGAMSGRASVTVKSAVVAVTGVTLDKSSLELTAGESVTLVATVAPDNASDKSLTWASDHADIASVDNSGKVTALKEGSATISATAGAMSGKATVTVKPAIVAVTGVTLDKSSLEIAINGTAQLTATVKPDNASDKSLTWASDHSDIASVDNSGKVMALKDGSATITVTTKNGGKTATCKITVTGNSIKINGAGPFNYDTGSLGKLFEGKTVTRLEWVDGEIDAEDVTAIQGLKGSIQYADMSNMRLVDDGTTYSGYSAKDLKVSPTKLPEMLFDSAVSLSNVILPKGLTSIGELSLRNTSIESIDLYEGIVTLERYCFTRTNIRSIKLPESLTEVDHDSFNTKLEEISTGSKITTLYIYNSKSLTKVHLGASIVDVGFDPCDQIKMIDISPENKAIKFSEGILISSDGKRLMFYPADQIKNGIATIPEGIEYISVKTLVQRSGLMKLVLPSTFKGFPTYSIQGTSITTITVKALTPPSFDYDLKSYCNNLTAVYVPASAVETYKEANGWKKLASIIFPLE